MECNNSSIYNVLIIIKNLLNIIHIIVPILLMVFITIQFIELIKNPEEKNGIKKITNQLIAATIIFFIPTIINALMYIVGNNTSISSCWNTLPNKIDTNITYISIGENNKKSINPSPSDYEKGTKKNTSEITKELVDASAGEKIARFGAQLAGYATGNVSKGGPHWPGWYPNHGNIYLHEGTGGSGKNYPNIGVGYDNYQELPNDLTNLHDFWFVVDMVSRYPATKKGVKLYWSKEFAYAGMWPIIFATIRGSYDPSFTHSNVYLDTSVQNGTYNKITTTFGKLDQVAQPGDIIGGANMGHVWIWIGNNIVKDYWPNAPTTAKMLTASGQEGLWPNIVNSNYGVWKGNVKATIYRPTGKVSIKSNNPLVVDLTKYGLTNNQGFNANESTIRQNYCDSHWPHPNHK